MKRSKPLLFMRVVKATSSLTQRKEPCQLFLGNKTKTKAQAGAPGELQWEMLELMVFGEHSAAGVSP